MSNAAIMELVNQGFTWERACEIILKELNKEAKKDADRKEAVTTPNKLTI